MPLPAFRHRARVGALALAAAAAACFSCIHQPDDPTFRHHTLADWIQTAEGTRSPAGPARRRGAPVLYIDASASMRGFSDPAGSFEYSRALRAVATMADQLDAAQPLTLRRVDAAARQAPAAAPTLLTVTRSAGFYNGAASDIAATIRSFGEAPQPAAHAADRPNAVDLFVTDGVQSLPLDVADSRCAAGADARCANAAIAALIDRGWGVHIFGIRSRFSGPVYSETRGGGQSGVYRAVDPADPARYRPFLLLVFTENREDLQPVVDRLREAVQAGLDPRLVRELPLTLPLVKRARPALDTAAYAVKDAVAGGSPVPNPLRLATEDTWRVDFNDIPLSQDVQVLQYLWQDLDFLHPGAVHIAADIELTEAGRAFFGSAARDAASELRFTVREVARPRAWYESAQSLAWPPAGYQLKRLQFEEALADTVSEPLTFAPATAPSAAGAGAGGHLVLRWTPSGDYLPLTLLRVEGRFDPARLRLPAWIESWSTEDDSKPGSANQLLNLKALVSGLLRNSSSAAQTLKPWYLVIWPSKV